MTGNENLPGDEPLTRQARPGPPQEEITLRAEEATLLEASPLPPEPAWLIEQMEHAPLPPEPDGNDGLFWESIRQPPDEPNWDDPFWQGSDWEPICLPGPAHPTGRWRVVIWERSGERQHLRVLEASTRQVVWHPTAARLLAWSPHGEQVAIIREQVQLDPARPPIVGTLFQHEVSYRFERYRWPELELLGSCPLQLPAEPWTLLLWPQHEVAVCEWGAQGESGLAWIWLSEDGDEQAPDLPQSAADRLESERVFLEYLLVSEDGTRPVRLAGEAPDDPEQP